MTYSTLCSEVASRGFFVAAVEHADGSASSARKINSNGDLEWVPTKKVIGDDYNVRNGQVNIRAKECLEALNMIKSINSGERNGVKHVFGDDNNEFQVESLENKVDFDKDSVLLGHSFGGSTIVKALQVGQDEENKINFDSAFCLDAWMFPIRFESRTTFSKISSKTPVFFFNYEKFQWKRNLTTMRVFETRLACQDQDDADRAKINEEEASQERRDLASASSKLLNPTVQGNVATLKAAVHYVASDVPTLMAGTWLGHLASALDFKKLFKRSGDQNEAEAHHKPMTPEEGLVASQDIFLGFLKTRGFSPSDELKSDGTSLSVQDFDAEVDKVKHDLIWGTRYLGTLPKEEEDK